jgi:hypothetical protein
MSWFTKFDSWVKSIGDKTIKPVAKGAVYVTSSLLGVPGAGAKITDAWDTQEQINERQNAQNLTTVQNAQTAQRVQSFISSIPNSWYFFGFLILLYIFYNSNKNKKK